MNEPSFATVQGAWAELLLRTLVLGGVRDFVVSPGSRSTPLVLGLARIVQDKTMQVRVHSVIDERAASFFALGLARASERPPCLICTSGSAPAHYYPAVIEASEARVPLIVLSADRPPELQATRAPQTIDQTRLYGPFTRGFFDLGIATLRHGAFDALVRKVLAAIELAATGPVHLNIPFAKPLEPSLSETLSPLVRPPLERAPRLQSPAPLPLPLGPLVTAYERAQRPLFVFGELTTREARAALRLCRWLTESNDPGPGASIAPRTLEALVWAEAASNLPALADVDLTLRSAPTALDTGPGTPDLVVQWGGSVCSSRYADWLEKTRAEVVIVSSTTDADPNHRANLHLSGSWVHWANDEQILPPLDRRPIETTYLERMINISNRSRSLAARPSIESATGLLSEVETVRTLLRMLPPDATLLVGNSLPLRLVNWLFSNVRADLRCGSVLVQRGTNGIDGWLAFTAGVANIEGPGPVVALLGDVTTAHDLGSLSLLREVQRPTTVVVLDNDGGRIFDLLPLAQRPPENYELWRTRPRLDFVRLAEAFELPTHAPKSQEALAATFTGLWDARETTPGARRPAALVHLHVDPEVTHAFLAGLIES